MIIYGRLLSTFTRRTLIWATLQDRGFEHRPIQVVGEEFEDLIKVHPGGRVPAVELPDGTVLVDSAAIIDYLEFSAPIDMRLMPQDELSRRQAAALFGHATAGAEKATAHFYETNRRPEPYRWADWADRLARQVGGSLDVLEARLLVDLTPGFSAGGRANRAERRGCGRDVAPGTGRQSRADPG